jgi:hypothetical protein
MTANTQTHTHNRIRTHIHTPARKLLSLCLALSLAAAVGAGSAAAAEEEVAFLYFGDIQTVESARADFAAWGELAGGALERSPDAAFVLQGGDIVDSGIDRSQWDAFLENRDAALGDIPFYPTNGNHESNFLGGKPELYLEIFDLPQNGPEGFKGEFYSFDYGQVHILILNSWIFSGEQKLTQDDYARIDKWIADDLAGAAPKWRIAVTHIPLYAVHSDVTSNRMRERWGPIFETFGLDLLLVGHQHVYSRLRPLTDGQTDYEDGVTQIMGNSGRKFYSSADETLAERTLYGVSTYQLIRADSESLTVQTIDGDGAELDFTALTPRAARVTRLTYIETLWRLSGSPISGAHPFTDVAHDNAPVAWAFERGLVRGYGDGRFGPDDALTQAHIQIIDGRIVGGIIR